MRSYLRLEFSLKSTNVSKNEGIEGKIFILLLRICPAESDTSDEAKGQSAATAEAAEETPNAPEVA